MINFLELLQAMGDIGVLLIAGMVWHNKIVTDNAIKEVKNIIKHHVELNDKEHKIFSDHISNLYGKSE